MCKHCQYKQLLHIVSKKKNEEEFWTIQLNVERSIRLWKHVTQPFECRFSLGFQFMSETYGFCLFAYVNICVVIIMPIELSKFRFVILFWHVIILLDMHMHNLFVNKITLQYSDIACDILLESFHMHNYYLFIDFLRYFITTFLEFPIIGYSFFMMLACKKLLKKKSILSVLGIKASQFFRVIFFIYSICWCESWLMKYSWKEPMKL